MRGPNNLRTSTYRSRGPRRAWLIVALVALVAVVAAAYALTSSSGDLASADEGAAPQEATEQEATEQEAAETEEAAEETTAEEATGPEDEESGEGREEEPDEEVQELREQAEEAGRSFLESMQLAEAERAEEEREAEEQAAAEREAEEQAAEEQAAAESEAEEEVPPPEDPTLSMTVPSLGLEGDTVRDTDSPEALHEGAIKLPSTGYPWEEGANTYIAAHRIGYPGTESHNQFFDLPAMQEGDAVFLTDANGTEYEYRVTEIFAVSPTDTWVTEPIPGRDMVTLQTCTDSVDPSTWWDITPRLMEAGPDSGRLVVRADRV